MIRSTKVSINSARVKKRCNVNIFLEEYRRVIAQFVDLLWEEKDVPSLLPKKFTTQVQTWLTARMIQCCGKQASGIVRGTRKKYEQRNWRLAKLKQEGKDTKILEKAITPISKPDLTSVSAELDERFIKVDLDNQTSFDGWITIGCIGRKMKLVLPFKRHKHFNELDESGEMTKGARIGRKNVTFIFNLPDVPKKRNGEILGIDIGVTNCIATSQDNLSKKDVHGHTLTSIMKKLSLRKKGSNGFRQAQNHRKNYINWAVNQLDLTGVKEIRRENIKNLRKGKKSSRFLAHWTYTDIFDKLDRLCEKQGVLVTKVNPAYTSQICAKCGTKGKRRGKHFSCSCRITTDSDLNAALNILSASL